ncbi:MAG: ankyrin repeat domain-containing protein [Pseudomonadota bacterium]
MGAHVLRKFHLHLALLAMLAGSFSLWSVASPASAQLFSEGYQFLEAVRERDGDAVTEMLNQPGTTIINTRDITTGDTGLHVVTQRRDTLWVRFLIQRGANPNIRNNKGSTPIQIATTLGFIDGVEELIKGGAQVDVADQQGETPLISAVHQRSVPLVARLLKQGADPDRNDNSGRSARDYMELMSSNTLLRQEFEAADAEREKAGTKQQYGPSF